MTRILREHLALVVAAAFLGLFFVFGLGGGERVMLNRLVMIIGFVLAVLAWKPLHKRFRAWAIIVAAITFVAGGIAIYAGQAFATVILLIGGIVGLYDGRQKPIEQRKATVAWCVIHGLWDQLAKDGVPSDEIERLKRLTQKERADLWAALSKGRGGDSSAQRLNESFDNFGLDDFTGFSLASPRHKSGYDDD